MKQVNVPFNTKNDLELLKKIDKAAKENYMSRSHFMRMAARMYIKYIKIEK